MADFKRSIGGPDLNFSGPTARRPVDTGAGKFQAIEQIAQVAIKAGGKAAARSAGAEIRGEGETATEVDDDITGLEFDLALADVGADKPLNKAQMEDFRASKFDEVLTSQKKIQSALSRGLISSTTANARMNMLRSEALSNPFIAMFQNELDDALFTSTGGSGRKGSQFFGPTAAEQDVAAARKGQLKAIEENAKVVNETALNMGVSNQAAGIIVANEKARAIRVKELEASRAELSYTSERSTALAQDYLTNNSTQALGVINNFIQAGAQAQDVQGAKLALAQLREQTAAKLQESRFRTDPATNQQTLVMRGTDFEKLNENLNKQMDSFEQMLSDQSTTEKLLGMFKERQAGLDLQAQAIDMQVFRQMPVMWTLSKNMPEVAQVVVDQLIGQNVDLNKFSVQTNPLLNDILSINQEARANLFANSADKTFNTPGAVLNTQEQGALAVTAINKGGAAAITQGYANDAGDMSPKIQSAPIALRDIVGNREWQSKLRTPEGQAAVTDMIEGASARAVTDQFTNALKKESSRRTSGTRVPKTSTSLAGIPDSISVTRTESKKRGGGRSQTFSIDSGGVPLTDKYKSEIVNTLKLGEMQPSLWNTEFESIDDWINALFTRGEEPAGLTEEDAEEVRGIEGFAEKVNKLEEKDLTTEEKAAIESIKKRFGGGQASSTLNLFRSNPNLTLQEMLDEGILTEEDLA